MKIHFLGTGSIVPTEGRFASGILIEASNIKLLLDCGPGCIEKLRRIGVYPQDLNALLITHFHVDHVSDMLPLIKARAYGRDGFPALPPQMLEILGPKGLEKLVRHLVVDITEFSYISRMMRCFNYLKLTELSHGDKLFRGDWSVEVAEVEHYNGIAYKVVVEDKSIVYSGDTLPDKRLIELARECDLLIHECSFPHETLIGKHTSDRQLAEILGEVKAKKVAVVHLYPAWEGREETLVEQLSKASRADIHVARDMDIIEL